MKKYFYLVLFFSATQSYAQSAEAIQANFCKALKQVFELGIKDNFETYDGTMVKQSPFLPVPAYGIKLEKFALNYADKDNRFVAKTNLNLDSLSSMQELEAMKIFTGNCLDTLQWSGWSEINGDDTGTVFFKELKEAKAFSGNLELTLAVVKVAAKIYSINLYVKRK